MPNEQNLPDPITRDEKYLAKAAGVEVAIPYPETRNEKYLAKACGMEIETPTPYTREEKYLNAIAEGGGGGSATLIEKNITVNGTYNASDDEADGYRSVSVDVANSYTASDEGKVVSNSSLIAQTSTTATTNGTIDTTTNNEVVVDVPNTYTAGDEGKVVSSGELVAQIAYPTTITENGTYNTTENNSVTVDVSSLPTGTDLCKLTPVSSDITSSEMYAVNIGDATIVFGFFTATAGASKIFSYPSSFNFAHTRKCKYWLNADTGNYLSSSYDYSVNTSSNQVSLYRAGSRDYPVVYCFT